MHFSKSLQGSNLAITAGLLSIELTLLFSFWYRTSLMWTKFLFLCNNYLSLDFNYIFHLLMEWRESKRWKSKENWIDRIFPEEVFSFRKILSQINSSLFLTECLKRSRISQNLEAITLKTNKKTRWLPPVYLHFENFNIFGGLYITQLNMEL